MTTHQLALRALERYSLNNKADLFNADAATIFYAGADGEIFTGLQHPDVYQGLEQMANLAEAIPEVRFLGVLTTGWAAPMTDGQEPGCAPSEHPGRRRCMIISVVDHNLETGSILKFEDDPANTIDDLGEGSGPLADMLKGTMAAIRFHFLTSK